MSEHEPTRDESIRQRRDTPCYVNAAGGWDSPKNAGRILADQRSSMGAFRTLMRRDRTGGHMCSSCAWTKPEHVRSFEVRKDSAKAAIRDLARDRCGPDFPADRNVTGWRALSDPELEKAGRVTHPMRHDAATGHHAEMTPDEAFQGIAVRPGMHGPKTTVVHVHGSLSKREAGVPQNPKVKWDRTGGHDLIRDLIEATYPDKFRDFNDRLSCKAGSTVPGTPISLGAAAGEGEMTLIILWRNGRFDTTVHGFLVPVEGPVTLERAIGCAVAYCPETIPLVPVQYRDESSHAPACKDVPVRIRAEDGGARARAAA